MSNLKSKKSAKKDKIYQEAALLFQEKGYLASSMRELANRVGIEASSLYSHISSKAEILSKICFDTAHMYISKWKDIDKQNSSTIEKLEMLIDFHVQMAFDNPVSVTVFNDEWRHLNDEERKAFLALRKQYESLIVKSIRKGINANEIQALQAETICFTLLNGLKWVHFIQGKTHSQTKERMQKELKSILLNGILQN
jgi:AcrR family transcriptional regulator